MSIGEMNPEDLIIEMTPAQMAYVYDKVKHKHIIDDVMMFIEYQGLDIDSPEIIADLVAQMWILRGAYDCNLSYWDNIEMLINMVKGR